MCRYWPLENINKYAEINMQKSQQHGSIWHPANRKTFYGNLSSQWLLEMRIQMPTFPTDVVHRTVSVSYHRISGKYNFDFVQMYMEVCRYMYVWTWLGAKSLITLRHLNLKSRPARTHVPPGHWLELRMKYFRYFNMHQHVCIAKHCPVVGSMLVLFPRYGHDNKNSNSKYSVVFTSCCTFPHPYM